MTEDITFRSDIPVVPLATCADDDDVIQAMFVSTDKMETVASLSEDAKYGRINSLMKNRHGTPFEHTFFKVKSEAPIFVYREWHRHRIGISINEQSGRYDELPPMFYIPPPERLLMQKPGSKQMDYELVPGTPELYDMLVRDLKIGCYNDYELYQKWLRAGVVKEVARIKLPVNIYSKMVWTCNARSLMSFLSLRTRREPFVRGEIDSSQHNDGALFPSKPQWEINVAADLIEELFAEAMPLTHRAFCANGRVAP